MKNWILFIGGFLLYFSGYSQVLQPQQMPCLGITQFTLDNGLFSSGGISSVDCIENTTDVSFPSDETYSVKAGESIHFTQETYIGPDNANQYHAFIEQPGFDLGWYEPQTVGEVGQFEKLEIGLQFEDVINDQISDYLTHDPWMPQPNGSLNPFNPNEIDIYAEFYWHNGDNVWQGPIKVNGFYYDEYLRGGATWGQQSSQHNFRFRFSPRNLGFYKGSVTSIVDGQNATHSEEFYFQVVPSNSEDYLSIGDNKWFLKSGDETFYPLGQNLPWPGDPLMSSIDNRSEPSHYDSVYQQMTNLSIAGCNYARYIVAPWASEIEFEHLNNYTNRMDQAWEFDRLLDTAKALGIRLHYNMQVHYSHEWPGYYYFHKWDWPKFGDPDNDNPFCVFASDSGYCYRRELDLLNPADFISNTEAKKNYKHRLRYMIARWGYSTSIGIMELFSEVNNLAARTEIGADTAQVCARTDYPGNAVPPAPYGKPYDFDPSFRQGIEDWQIEMCQFIKDSLGHFQHLLGVNYTGAPEQSDSTFQSSYVDVPSYNLYGLSVGKFYNESDLAYNYHSALQKPIMHSEYGSGIGQMHCDNEDVVYKKGLCLHPFTGLGATGMSWDFVDNANNVWQYFGPISSLMDGLKLDQEDWTPFKNTYENELIEMLYLKKTSGDYLKAAGALSNRTYNYYTQSTDQEITLPDGDTLDCAQESVLIDTNFLADNGGIVELQQEQDFQYRSISDQIIIPDMQDERVYVIRWYNSFTGVNLVNNVVTSTPSGDLELDFPGTLSGSGVSPILFFTINRLGFPLKQSSSDTSQFSEENLQLIDLLEYDPEEKSTLKNEVGSSLEENHIKSLSLYPNPTKDTFYASVRSDGPQLFYWNLYSNDGRIVASGSKNTAILEIDISTLASGMYIFEIKSENERFQAQITKQ